MQEEVKVTPMKDGKPDMTKMSLAEQLQWQKAENERKSQEKAAAAKMEEPGTPKFHDPRQTQTLSSAEKRLAEQIANRKKLFAKVNGGSDSDENESSDSSL